MAFHRGFHTKNSGFVAAYKTKAIVVGESSFKWLENRTMVMFKTPEKTVTPGGKSSVVLQVKYDVKSNCSSWLNVMAKT